MTFLERVKKAYKQLIENSTATRIVSVKPIVWDAYHIEVRPGDSIVVRYTAGYPSIEEKSKLREMFPEHDVVFITNGAELYTVGKPR